ncbi:MAG: hypothetical protein A2Y12_14080 [Planctomycetes bacterium GWF2_42_9]|nr:MAG: hypothetical protein A2Y12_14080 [Planctomycetes bacterium GWF2_42_9]
MVLRRNTIDTICRDGKNNKIEILYDLNGQWKDVEFKNIKLANGLIVSAKVCEGQINYLQIRNTSQENITTVIDVNPIYKNIKKQTVCIAGLSTITLK